VTRLLLCLPLLCGGVSADLGMSANVVGVLQAHVSVPEHEEVRLASSVFAPPVPSVRVAGASLYPGSYRVTQQGYQWAYTAPGGFVRYQAQATGGGQAVPSWSGNAVMLAAGPGFDLVGGPEIALTLQVIADPE
jgi:hypothetical protein